MIYAAEFVNDNGISAIALGFFTALFGMLGTVILGLRKQRNEVEIARLASLKAAENTANVSNGFAKRMDTKLDRIELMVTDHINWHLHQKEGNKNGDSERS